MLRKGFNTSQANSREEKTKRKRVKRQIDKPLGVKKTKEDSEKELESLVLGGDQNILDELYKSAQVKMLLFFNLIIIGTHSLLRSFLQQRLK